MRSSYLFIFLSLLFFVSACKPKLEIVESFYTMEYEDRSIGGGENINCINVRGKTGIAGGSAGGVFFTPNGGYSWERRSSQNFNISEVQTVDSVTYLVVASDLLYRSTDAANTWSIVGSNINDTIFNVKGIFFFPDGHGYATDEHTIWESIDKGATWNYKSSWGPEELTHIHFRDSLNGMAGLAENGVIFTDDGGQTWKKDSTEVLGLVTDIVCTGKYRGYACTKYGSLYSFTGNLSTIAQSVSQNTQQLAFNFSPLMGVAAGKLFYKYKDYTADNSETFWVSTIREDRNSFPDFNDVCFSDPYRILAVGNNGTFYIINHGKP